MNNTLKGNIFILLTAICLSFSTVYTHYIVQDINPIVVAFFSFLLIASLLFAIRIVYLGGMIDLFSTIKKSYKSLFFINLTSAIDWIFFLIALKYINGSFVNAIVFGITPIATLLFTRNITKIQCLLSGCILILLVIIGLNYVNVERITRYYFETSIIFSTIAGIAVGGTTIFLKKLHNEGVKVFDVILLRYIMIVAVAAIIILIKHYTLIINWTDFSKLFFISILFVLLPSYFVQKGIAYISPFNTAVISSSIPAITYLIGAALSIHFNLIQIVAIACLSFVLVLNNRSHT